jgi:predicted enzyme related to lactoylglutathione lyase
MKSVAKHLMEIILYVQDMRQSVWFYKDVLGLKVRFPNDVEDYSDEMWVEFETGDCTLALHGGAQEISCNKHELIFRVDDIAEARNAILKSGIEIGEIRILEDGAPIAEGIDPAGHRFAIR